MHICTKKKKKRTHVFHHVCDQCSPHRVCVPGSALPISQHGSSYSASALDWVWSMMILDGDRDEFVGRKREKKQGKTYHARPQVALHTQIGSYCWRHWEQVEQHPKLFQNGFIWIISPVKLPSSRTEYSKYTIHVIMAWSVLAKKKVGKRKAR